MKGGRDGKEEIMEEWRDEEMERWREGERKDDG